MATTVKRQRRNQMRFSPGDNLEVTLTCEVFKSNEEGVWVREVGDHEEKMFLEYDEIDEVPMMRITRMQQKGKRVHILGGAVVEVKKLES